MAASTVLTQTPICNSTKLKSHECFVIATCPKFACLQNIGRKTALQAISASDLTMTPTLSKTRAVEIKTAKITDQQHAWPNSSSEAVVINAISSIKFR